MIKRSQAGFLLLLILALTAMACNFSNSFLGPADDAEAETIASATSQLAVATPTARPTRTLPTPTDTAVPAASRTLAETLRDVEPNAAGDFTVTLTDDQFNRAISEEEAAALQQGSDLPIRNAEVTFVEDYVLLVGDVTDPLPAAFAAILRPTIVDGRLRLQAESAELGGFPMPASMLDVVDSNVNQAVVAALGDLESEVAFESVAIDEGELVVQGRER